MALNKAIRRIADQNDGIVMNYHKLNGIQITFDPQGTFTRLSFAGYASKAIRNQEDGAPIGGVMVKLEGAPSGTTKEEIMAWAYAEAKKSPEFNGRKTYEAKGLIIKFEDAQQMANALASLPMAYRDIRPIMAVLETAHTGEYDFPEPQPNTVDD